MHQYRLLLLLFLFISQENMAQYLSAFSDYKNYFYVFDRGARKELEYLPVKWYRVGNSNVTYLDETGDLKVYYEGKKYTLAFSNPDACTVTDDFTLFRSNDQLNAFYRGETIFLCNRINKYIAGDSIVGFYNAATAIFSIFYNGRINDLPSTIYIDTQQLYAGDNLIAYPGEGQSLKIYYKGKIYDTGTSNYMVYEAAANTLAFFDRSTQEFKVFHKGKIRVVENSQPGSCSVGDDLTAYQTPVGAFKVFYENEVMELNSFVPDFYKVQDQLLVFAYGNNFNVFYKGKVYLLENYIPREYKLDAGTLVYKNQQEHLKAFYDGNVQQLTKERIKDFDLQGNTVKFMNSLNEPQFFSGGKLF